MGSHPEEGVPMVGQQSVRLGLVLAVKRVQTELLLLFEEETQDVKVLPMVCGNCHMTKY